ncbi:hypothetical protein OQA88_3496 [Cercophora sp. LCS_1]
MGHYVDDNDLEKPVLDPSETPLKTPGNADPIRSFEIAGLASPSVSKLTGMRDDIVLLSWLIVLLRTKEEGELDFDWAYRSHGTAFEGDKRVEITLASDGAAGGLQTTVRQLAKDISHQLRALIGTFSVNPATLLLSTGTLLSNHGKESAEVSRTAPGDLSPWLTGSLCKQKPTIHLEARFNHGRLYLHPAWHSDNILPYTVTRYIETLVDTIRFCISNPEKTVRECLSPTTHDLDTIWRWNSQLPPTLEYCMHEVVEEETRKHPEKLAIHSWDGDLTYAQVDEYSTILADKLRSSGVQHHDFLPICFEKSRWTIVAVLATMKAGATMVMMDPSLPLMRLQNMARQVSARTILTSPKQRLLSQSIIPAATLIELAPSLFSETPAVLPLLPPVPSSALMYVIFTSGSTGTPKGVQISHRAYTSSAIPRALAVGYVATSRVLDFASYAFDVSIDNMLLTLANGGCLCIPSDEDRLNDVGGVIRSMGINYAGITPSMARILDTDVIASLTHGLGLGGEAISATDAKAWGEHARIIIGYGPCECTIGCTINSSAATGRDYISIGPGNGAAIWIVDPDNHEILMSVGAVGELLVEGPIVGEGYLNDPEKTAASFIQDPSWLVAGHGCYQGRQGRLYKTGDLGRYDPDGSGGIVFVGRKDTQVKLRGQRVELGEIESQLKARLPQELGVIAEVIVPSGPGGQPTLVAFVAPQVGNERLDQRKIEAVQFEPTLRQALSEAETGLAKVLPRYMVPNAYITINHIPTLISGKTDRKRLRQFGTDVDLRKLGRLSPSRIMANGMANGRQDLDMVEKCLRDAWATVLQVEANLIRTDDNFFALGGDSLAAMRLVSISRELRLDLSVVSVFGNPTLSAMASVAKSIPDAQHEHSVRSPFAMITLPVNAARAEAATICGVSPTDVHDMYPCTPTQEALITFSLKSTQAYVAQRVATIPSHINLDTWKTAWETVISKSPILRTRLVQLQSDSKLLQVVLNEKIKWRESTSLDLYLASDKSENMTLGQSLARYAIVSTPEKHCMVWTLHHTLYDGWSEPLILHQVYSLLTVNQITPCPSHMGDFVNHLQMTPEAETQQFWRRELEGAVAPQFPLVPSRDFLPSPDVIVERHISLPTMSGFPFTLATLIRAAWALVSSKHSGSEDVVFGETLTGRDIPLPNVESIVGPLIATVPVRVRIDREATLTSYLQTVQQSILARGKYQHMGMQNIRKVSRDAQYAVESPMGIVIQPEPAHGVCEELGFVTGDVVKEAIHFNPYSLMLACGIQEGGFRVCASFDSSLVGTKEIKRILVQLETVCGELTWGLDRKVGQLPVLGTGELDMIWSWNKDPPLGLDGDWLRADTGLKHGETYPRAAVPWVCDPRNPNLLTPVGCTGELWIESALAAGEGVIDSPTWLIAGSQNHTGRRGRLQPTGDMASLQEDGNIVFVGRKDDVMPARGHSINIADLELHFTKYLDSAANAAAALCQELVGNSSNSTGSSIVVFVEQRPSKDGFVEILPSWHQMVYEVSGFRLAVSTKLDITLAAGLRRLDRFALNSLPPHLVPSAYVVVDRLPMNGQEVDRGLLAKFAAKISPVALTQLRQGLEEAWKKPLTETTMTPAEAILRSSWAKILDIESEKIDVDDNFFRLGGDSVLAMKLVSDLRALGHVLTVADVFRHMRLNAAAKALKLNQASRAFKAKPYRPFSLFDAWNIEMLLDETIRPQLADPRWFIQDVYPATDSQVVDIGNTINSPRTSIQYTALYFDKSIIDSERLLQACNDLVQAHDILRTVFIAHSGTYLQVVLGDDFELPIATHQTELCLTDFVSTLCSAHIRIGFPLGSPPLQFSLVESSTELCLVLALSHALYDGMSLPLLLRHLSALYTSTSPPVALQFSAYLSVVHSASLQTAAASYWTHLLSRSSLSILPKPETPPGSKSVYKTAPVPGFTKSPGTITLANLLTASWALLLARRLRKVDVTFGSVTSGRSLDMTDVEHVAGPCYAFTPVRVIFEPSWTTIDLLESVQQQSAESSSFDYLGFARIKECAHWEYDMFDSVVHYQDWEDFDTMPFADGECRVEISNPDGDSGNPLKVVSFMREGNLVLGVVGMDEVFLDEVLRELVGVVGELGIGEGPLEGLTF